MQTFWRNFLRGAGSALSLFPDTASRRAPFSAELPEDEESPFLQDWENISGDFERAVGKMSAAGELPPLSAWKIILENPLPGSQPLPVNGRRN